MAKTIMAVCFMGIALSFPLWNGAQAADAGQPEGFAKEFVDTINSKNTGRRLALLHPGSRACINARTQPYYDWIFTRQSRHVIPAAYKVTTSPVPGDAPLMSDGRSDYPLRPTQQLQIDFETGPYRSTSIVLLIARDGAAWREVLPCPRPEAVAHIKEAEARRVDHDHRVRSLVAGLADPLRAEVIALAREGRRIDAIKKYREASGEDLSTAKSVVDLLVPGEPRAE